MIETDKSNIIENQFDKIKEQLKKETDETKSIKIFINFLNKNSLTGEQVAELFNLVKSSSTNIIMSLLKIYLHMKNNQLALINIINEELSNIMNYVAIGENQLKNIGSYNDEKTAYLSIRLLDERIGNEHQIIDTREKKLAFIYLWFVTEDKFYNSSSTSMKASVFERAYIKYFASVNDTTFRKYQCSFIPMFLEKTKPIEYMNKMYYLFYGMDNEIELQKQLNDELVKNNNYLNTELTNKRNTNISLEQKVNELELMIDNLKILNEELTKKNKQLQANLVGENLKNEEILKTLKRDIYDDLEVSVILEVEGIQNIIDTFPNIPDRAKVKIDRALRRIEKKFKKGQLDE